MSRMSRLRKQVMQNKKMTAINWLLNNTSHEDRIIEYQFNLKADEWKFIPYFAYSYDFNKEANDPNFVLHGSFDEIQMGSNDGSYRELCLTQKLEIIMINNDVNVGQYTWCPIRIGWRDGADFPAHLRDTGRGGKDATNVVGEPDGITGLQFAEKSRKFVRKINHGSIKVKSQKKISKVIRMDRQWRERPRIKGIIFENRSHDAGVLGDNDNASGDTSAELTFMIFQRMQVYKRTDDPYGEIVADTLDADAT